MLLDVLSSSVISIKSVLTPIPPTLGDEMVMLTVSVFSMIRSSTTSRARTTSEAPSGMAYEATGVKSDPESASPAYDIIPVMAEPVVLTTPPSSSTLNSP